MTTKPARVLITGTTSGLGRGLLDAYVKRGAQVISVNRRRTAELESRYPRVRFECVDVRSSSAVASLLIDLAESGSLPDVLFLNAGINRVDNDASFDRATYEEVLATNLFGVLNFVAPLTELAPSRQRRHVIAISSMAGYVGNPYGLGYSTSKQALTACFDAWSRMYAGTDLIFQQVVLGPLQTQMFTMSDRFPAWMSWLRSTFAASVESAVDSICRFAGTRRRKLFHPRRALLLYLGTWACRAVIPSFFRGRKTLAGHERRAPSRAT